MRTLIVKSVVLKRPRLRAPHGLNEMSPPSAWIPATSIARLTIPAADSQPRSKVIEKGCGSFATEPQVVDNAGVRGGRCLPHGLEYPLQRGGRNPMKGGLSHCRYPHSLTKRWCLAPWHTEAARSYLLHSTVRWAIRKRASYCIHDTYSALQKSRSHRKTIEPPKTIRGKGKLMT